MISEVRATQLSSSILLCIIFSPHLACSNVFHLLSVQIVNREHLLTEVENIYNVLIPPDPASSLSPSLPLLLIDASAYENYTLPKLYIKMYYSVEAAVHQRIVRVRSVENRRIREYVRPQRGAFKK